MTTDICTMTLPQILAADRDVRNVAVEWAVFSDDLTADMSREYQPYTRLSAAIAGWLKPYWEKQQAWPYPRGGSIYELWNGREGQPWQASLEAHVAAYRHPARDFHAGMGEAWWIVERMKELAQAKHPMGSEPWFSEPWVSFMVGCVHTFCLHDFWLLTPSAIVDAGLRATWKPQEQEK